jgi:hypothetical protein
MADSISFYDSERGVATTTVRSQASYIIDNCLNYLGPHRTVASRTTRAIITNLGQPEQAQQELTVFERLVHT